MECPKCGEKAHIVTTTRGTTTLLGAGAGGYVAATAGAKTGAAVGSLFCPEIGTAIGGFLGILIGAAAGAVAGNTVGKLIDENVMRVFCRDCGCEFGELETVDSLIQKCTSPVSGDKPLVGEFFSDICIKTEVFCLQ